MNEEKSPFIKGINEQHPAAYHQLYNEYYKALVVFFHKFLQNYASDHIAIPSHCLVLSFRIHEKTVT